MVVKAIVRGSDPWDREFEAVCDHCQTRFSYHGRNDPKPGPVMVVGGSFFTGPLKVIPNMLVKCAVCGTEQNVWPTLKRARA